MILDSCSHSPVGGGVKYLKRKPATVIIDLADEITDEPPACKKTKSVSPTDIPTGQIGHPSEVVVVADDTEEQVDIEAGMNFGKPIVVEWDGKRRPFVDGLGLCSPTRWPPSCRAFHRPAGMKELAEETVISTIGDVRREAFRLATGNMHASPFDLKVLTDLRHRWSKLLESPSQALVVDEGQPFLLRGLAQWLKKFGDPDYGILVEGEGRFASGVWVGVDKPLPRCPQVFPEKLKHRNSRRISRKRSSSGECS